MKMIYYHGDLIKRVPDGYLVMIYDCPWFETLDEAKAWVENEKYSIAFKRKKGE